MTCAACRAWCATSEKQLSIRMTNMTGAPEVQANPCPKCGGVDWASSREMVKPRTTWRVDWMPVLHLVAALICGSLVIVSGPTWVGVANAALCALNVSGAAYQFLIGRMRRTSDLMLVTMEEMYELNRALIENRVEMIITRGDDAPVAPNRLH